MFFTKFSLAFLSAVLILYSGCTLPPPAAKGQIDSSFPLVSRGSAATFAIDPGDAEIVSVVAEASAGIFN